MVAGSFVAILSALLSAPPDPPPPALRLPGDVRPLRYALELTLVPERARFDGVIRIHAQVTRPTRVVWLNGTALEVTRATLGGREARVLAGGDDFVGLTSDVEIAAGPLAIEIAYRAPIDRGRARGVYAEEETGEWYAYTFFEPVDARRAFPCFDEPAYKVPWQLTFHVKKEHVALANAPVVSETAADGGLKTVVLAESKPLPSYLVAFVVGPFDLVDGGTAGREKTRVRFIVPRGRGGETRWAREVTPKVVAALEDYFDMPYPYEKLDVAVVPRFWGTMEHPGIVAMGQPLTLIPPDRETRDRRVAYANILAHELAHYWFGDLVTMAWWDDTWLNEALGSWMDAPVTDRVEPAWRYLDDHVFTGRHAMASDELASARRVRQTVESKEAIAASFDNDITYGKGAAVLGMFEHWVGRERFQAFIRAYVRKHAWGNASAEDFLAAMSASLGAGVAHAFRTFLDQPGAPLVAHELRCDGETPSLRLSQRRSLPAGTAVPAAGTWRVPVCIRHGTGGDARRECTLLAGARSEWALQGACPTWVVMNADGDGYYRSSYSARELAALLGPKGPPLTRRERFVLLGDLTAGLDRAELDVAGALALVPSLSADTDSRIVVAAARLGARMNPQHLDDELYGRYQGFVRALFGRQGRELGWTRGPGDDDERHRLRQALVPSVAAAGDPELARAARPLAEAWLRDRKGLEDDMMPQVLAAAARDGDRALFDAYRTAARKPRDRREQGLLVGALGSFRDPPLAAAARDLVLGHEFDLRESRFILLRQLMSRDTRPAAWEYVKAHLDTLLARLRHDEASWLLAAAAEAFCDRAHRAEAASLLAPRAAGIDGAQNALAKALDAADRCGANRERELPGVREVLSRY